jgi:hypothetical protein
MVDCKKTKRSQHANDKELLLIFCEILSTIHLMSLKVSLSETEFENNNEVMAVLNVCNENVEVTNDLLKRSLTKFN